MNGRGATGVLLAVLVCSCAGGEGAKEGEDFGSGSRLQAVFDEASAGVSRWRAFYDRDLGMECRFWSAVEGQGIYCLPTEGVFFAFSDAACSQAVSSDNFHSGQLPPEGTLVSGWADSGLPCNREPVRGIPYRIGAPTTSEIYYKDSDGRCLLSSPDQISLRELWLRSSPAFRLLMCSRFQV